LAKPVATFKGRPSRFDVGRAACFFRLLDVAMAIMVELQLVMAGMQESWFMSGLVLNCMLSTFSGRCFPNMTFPLCAIQPRSNPPGIKRTAGQYRTATSLNPSGN